MVFCRLVDDDDGVLRRRRRGKTGASLEPVMGWEDATAMEEGTSNSAEDGIRRLIMLMQDGTFSFVFPSSRAMRELLLLAMDF